MSRERASVDPAPGGVEVALVGGSPTDEEAAAVIAAVQVVMTSAAQVVVDEVAGPPPWRFSQRWWRGPVAVRRTRPGIPFARDW